MVRLVGASRCEEDVANDGSADHGDYGADSRPNEGPSHAISDGV